MRQITCVNGNSNISCIFGEEGFTPFLLENAEGIYELSARVTVTENTLTDGSTYQSSMLNTRNIVLTLRDREDADHTANRQFLLALFPVRSEGTLIYEDGSEKRQISYYVEKLTSDGVFYSRAYQISLICPDPYFYDTSDVVVTLAAFVPNFVFRHEFTAAKEEFGYRQANRLQNLKDEFGTDGIGMEITISASAPVRNPQIIRVESDEHIAVGTNDMPLDMAAGDRVIITTADNQKRIWFLHEGVRTNISHYLAEGSSFIQLHRGNNSIGYSAASGVDAMIISIKYRFQYASA